MDYQMQQSLPALFFGVARLKGNTPFLWEKREDHYTSLSWQDVERQVRDLANGLCLEGIKPGDRVALVADNSPRWVIAHLGIMACGAVSVPTYTTNEVNDHRHVFNDSGCRAVIVSSAALARNVISAAQQEKNVEFVIAMEDLKDEYPRILSWQAVLEAGAGQNVDRSADIVAKLKRNHLALLIYTSGTGGLPKGVMLSHGAILHNCEGAEDAIFPIRDKGEEVFLSFLPLSHSYEHMAGLFFPIAIGAQIYYAQSAETLMQNMQEVHPTIMCAVPRLFEAMHLRIVQGLRKVPVWRQKLFYSAVKLGRKRIERKLSWFEYPFDWMLTLLVRAKVRQRFGGRIKALISGGAALNPETGLFFQALGINVLQGYGQTESAPLISVNRPSNIKMYTVGPPVKNTEVKIAEDGEILVRGELLMQGYWNRPQQTAEVIIDGWLHTGDIGCLDAEGAIQIIDRKKDVIVLSGGETLSPAKIQGVLTMQPEIEQAMVVGNGEAYLSALIVPNLEWLKTWAKDEEATLSKFRESEALQKALTEAINKANVQLAQYERVRKILVAAEYFTISNELMTPSMKIRRHKILEIYGDSLSSLYKSRSK